VPAGDTAEEWVQRGVAELERCVVSTVDPGTLACAVLEPIMGEGGYVVVPPRFLLDLQRMCREHGIRM
jgi:4-aminobutyrate aminotransferase-like enzyme